MKDKGKKIIYLSNESFKEHIVSQGFEAYLYMSGDSRFAKVMNTRTNDNDKIKKYLDTCMSGYLRKLILALSAEKTLPRKIQQIIKLNPSAIVVDSMAPLYRPIIYYSHGISVFTLQTMVLSTKADAVPPACSGLLPSSNSVFKLYTEYLWRRQFLRRSIINLKRRIIYLGRDDLSLTKRIAKRYKFSFQNVERRRAFSYGFTCIPEIILSPRALDFPRLAGKNKVYAGFGVDLARRDCVGYEQNSRLEKIFLNRHKSLVYCSLGTLSTVHYRKSFSFLKKVIKAICGQPITLIIAVGKNIKTSQFDPIPPNVHVFQTVPQLLVLEQADVMITHGGMNSIKECILYEVPMLVYPLNGRWDQPGNAARVVYHGLGLRGNIQLELSKKIAQKVEYLLTNNTYKQNLRKMKAKVLAEDQHEEVASMIEATIGDAKKAA